MNLDLHYLCNLPMTSLLWTCTVVSISFDWWRIIEHAIDISHNNIRDIDPEAFDELSYAFYFDASYNLLTNFSQIPMKFQKGIKLLNVSFNQIQDIPRSSFPKLYELASIDFSHNNITDVGRSVFSTLFSIRHLNFR